MKFYFNCKFYHSTPIFEILHWFAIIFTINTLLFSIAYKAVQNVIFAYFLALGFTLPPWVLVYASGISNCLQFSTTQHTVFSLSKCIHVFPSGGLVFVILLTWLTPLDLLWLSSGSIWSPAWSASFLPW